MPFTDSSIVAFSLRDANKETIVVILHIFIYDCFRNKPE